MKLASSRNLRQRLTLCPSLRHRTQTLDNTSRYCEGQRPSRSPSALERIDFGSVEITTQFRPQLPDSLYSLINVHAPRQKRGLKTHDRLAAQIAAAALCGEFEPFVYLGRDILNPEVFTLAVIIRHDRDIPSAQATSDPPKLRILCHSRHALS